ncbi:MAG TPA: hypothetical protein VFO73_10605 [Candidatus Limnocylindrales bacterium]|nr:hypothetical protein [Candidatus Limnocylindrales bacterium]
MNRLRERVRALVSARPWPFHPVLFAAYFVLFLYSVNLEEAEFSDVLPVLIPVVLATAVLLVVGGFIVRDVRRAGIVLSAAVVALLAYGHVGGLLEPTKIGPGYQQLSWGLFGLLALVVAWRATGWIPRLTRILNVVALVLVIVPVVSIVPHELGRLSVAAAGPGPGATASPGTPAAGGPDIYWFVFDRYPSASSLRLAYGLENPIFDELRSRGFYVADRSHANYQQTTFSVQSTFSAEFLDGRGHADVFGPTDVAGEFSRIENSNVGRFLKARGYFYAHIGSDFSPTRRSKIADVNHAYDGFSDFQTAFVESTAVPGIARRLGVLPSPWKRRYDWTTWELNLLDRLPPYPSPKFVFGHLLLPHPPYIFGRDGQFLDETANRGRAAKEQFEEQLAYTNTRLLAIIDRLLALPEAERPVIIVQADEGPYPAGLRDNTGHDWTKETPERREIKFGILNAWYLPGGRDIGLYPEITPVNTFRILFNAYFGTDLPLLPDESYSVNHPEPLVFPAP